MRRRSPRRVLALVLLSLPLSGGACVPSAGVAGTPIPPSAPEPPIRVRVEERFYPVSGRDAAALNHALLLEGPRWGGRAAHGLTAWRLLWSYVPTRGRSACAPGNPRVEIRIVTILPRWTELDEASDGLARDWTLFYERLQRHETGHQEIAVRSGVELLSALAALRADDCALLLEAAEQAVAHVASSHEDRQRRFDRSTEHGMQPAGR